ncbi:piezo-type mechanosensitive ion channel component 2-like isoform X2 [Centruroides vittatus]|uniref:piezo-type mechanosensitive ion channel component 2-like isoform X2 n=1 Tax=Centruroides vittatus TaxID=120091 RepID=UPI0035108075
MLYKCKMAVSEAVCLCLFRIVLPIALLTAVIFRFNAFSFVYLILLLVAPLLPRPSSNSVVTGHTGRYLKSVIGISAIFCIAQVTFQIVLLSLGSYGSFINYCNWDGHLYGLIGLNRLDSIEVLQAIRLVGLDFLVFFCSVAVLVTCEKLQDVSTPCEGQEQMDAATLKPTLQRKKRTSEFFLLLGETLVLIFMAGAGILQPSIFSSVYFVAFLAICSWIACNLKLGHRYAISKVPLLIYCATHFTIIYIYQFDFAQQLIPHQSLYARLFGLSGLVNSNCTSARVLNFRHLNWTMYVSPFFIMGLYFLLATMLRYKVICPVREEIHKVENAVARGDSQRSTSSLLRRRIHKRDRAASLLENDHTGKSYRTADNARQNNSLELDPNGSIIWSSESEMRDASGLPDETTTVTSGGATSKYNKLFSPFIFFFRLIVKGSYVATLVIMMTWSITYHSWLTFILLLWSCTLWMIPNSRRACLYSSPALVIYAELLLILQYIYSFDLTEQELPSKVEGVNLAQIGLVKYHALSYQPLAIKILYTIMFWITLHQRIEESRRNSDRRLSESVVLEPFNISYSTSQPGAPRPEVQRQLSTVTSIITAPNQCLQYLGEVIKKFMTKFWIWIVACMLMVISLGGSSVVIYRIVYMFLFIFFILIFQFSYHIWRRIMYGFWLTVIVYSMIVLILIYTYQFQNVEKYWIEYLHVSKELQYDIGLEKYGSDPWPLFLKLLTPTFFLIITIIQLHYFHKEFLLISNLDFRPVENEDNKTAEIDKLNPQVGEDEATCITIHPDDVTIESTPKSEVPTVVASEQSSPTVKKEVTYSNRRKSIIGEPSKGELSKRIVIMFKKILKFALYIYELAWRFLEIHMIKIVMFSVVCLSTYDVCAVHFIFVVFAIIALPFRSIHTFVSHCCAVWAAVLFLSKMIYQLQSMNSSGWYSNCTSMSNASSEFSKANQPIDNMLWIGFQKTNNLSNYCKGYIGLLFVLTFQAVVKIRQKVSRYQNGESEPKPGIMFPKIKREHADCGVLECIKFMFNYFFYKFGVEFCFVTIVSCIGVRLDVYAVISAVWLCALFLLRRQTLAKIWCFYVAYLCLSLPFQYMLCVGIPPGFCIDYPWAAKSMNPELREWLFLPNFSPPPNSYKILVDFIQLLFACCQLYVFSIETTSETTSEADSYEGGSNKEIAYPKPGEALENPVSDFVTRATSYLDLIKVVVFFSSYWVTLAVVFLAGTIRVSLFAMGYVIGCFFFLWNGNEFYLQPLLKLLRMWNALLTYNVLVIFLKSILQVIGCVFMSRMLKNYCWVVQLFGIACLKKLPEEANSNLHKTDDDCQVPVDEAGLLWDGICFGFLLLQKRLFGSYYFQHLVNEIRAQQILASRGAELIHEIQMKEVQEQRMAEKEIMEKIKAKMDRIRAHQKKGKDGEYEEPPTHFQAIRSGDYGMFEDYSDEEIDLDISSKSKAEPDDDETAEVKQRGLNALLSQTIKSNLKYKVDDAKKGSEEVDDVGDSSQLSPIVSVDRSPVSRTVSGSSRHQGSEYSPRDHQDTAVPSTSSFSRHPSVQTKTRQCSVEDHGTVCMESGEKDSYLDDEPIEEDFESKLKRWLEFLGAFIESVFISATAKLNSISKDYRFVARQLSFEKKKLKEKFQQDFQLDAENLSNKDAALTIEPIPKENNKLEIKIKLQKGSQDLAQSVELLDACDALDKEFEKSHSTYVRFFVACYYAAVSRSEILCYVIIVINQMSSASILSLPLPLMAFLWGTLSVPRPTKTFWITIITYTEALVVVKYLFQFNFFPWNFLSAPGPFWAPRILGIEKNEFYAVFDLLLLLVVFFHRFMLKSLGLWKDSDRSSTDVDDDETPEKTIESEDTLVVALEDKLGKVEDSEIKPLVDEREIDVSLKKNDSIEERKDIACDGSTEKTGFFDGMLRYFDPFKQFFNNLLFPSYRVTVDVYAYMFFCDFINFFIVVFGYWAFGAGINKGVTSYFEENNVPVSFLIMLLAQFGLIVVDRALYLRKHILGKLIFQIFLVFLVHFWMFFILPAVTDKPFTSKKYLPPKLWYFVKCVYLLLSAYQIRSGYPTRILGNYFCKKYNYINLFLFKGYMAIPFLYELRSLMDWIWTDTSMNVGNWLKMEDIFAHVFVLKCQRRAEDEYPTPRGAKRSPVIKYGVGGSILLIIILIIWFPLLLFALGNSVGQSFKPYDCTIELAISGYEPIFKVSAQQNALQTLTPDQWQNMVYHFQANPSIQSFLANYDMNDVIMVELNSNSTSLWAISPPSQSALIKELQNETDILKMKISWSFSRALNVSSDMDKTVGNEYEILLQDKKTRSALASMLNGTEQSAPIIIHRIFPKFLRVYGKGKVLPIREFADADSNSDSNDSLDTRLYPRNLSISLRSGGFNNLSSQAEWWEVQEDCAESNYPYSFLRFDNCNVLRILAFNDRVLPSELYVLSKYGIVGLYTTFVLLVSRLIRSFVAGSSFTIMFDDMPYVDRVLQLCLDIYLVRESGEFSLEEDLFAKLLFLYRSPETLIKWTRFPERQQ